MSTSKYPKLYSFGHYIISKILFDEVIVEEKIDGSQFSFRKAENGKLFCRSKRVDIHVDEIEKSHMFYPGVQAVKKIGHLLNDKYTYRGEFLGKPKWYKEFLLKECFER